MPDFERRAADWLSVEDALRRVLGQVRTTSVVRVPLAEAHGRALAEPLHARATLPPWDNAAMDGYAVRGRDVERATPTDPARLSVTGRAMAGSPMGSIGSGEALRIMTGAPVPAGADSVVRVEDTDAEEGRAGTVRVRLARDVGRNIRPAGQDMRAGDVVLGPGSTMGTGEIARAAAAGHAEVCVHRPPRVGIVSTGDELRPLAHWADVERGAAIPDTNGPMLASAVEAAGGTARVPPPVADDVATLERTLHDLDDVDVLLTTGGASMGEGDLVKRVLDGLGFRLDFWRVTLRPGSPMSFGALPREGGGAVPVFGLPGNPASAYVTFELFVRPFLLAMAGHRRIHRPVIRATAGETLSSTARLTHVYRIRLHDADGVVHLAGPQGSGLVRTLDADGLAVVPRGVREIPAGESVQVILVRDGPGWSSEPARFEART